MKSTLTGFLMVLVGSGWVMLKVVFLSPNSILHHTFISHLSPVAFFLLLLLISLFLFNPHRANWK